MARQNADGRQLCLSGIWVLLSLAAALLAAAGCAAGWLAADRIYGQETVELADAAAAQDAVNLIVVAPLTVLLAVWASRESLRSYVCVLGFLASIAYNYAIYAFSIHFGPLFLLWVAVLGLSIFALAGGLATLNASAVKNAFAGRTLSLAAGVLIAVAGLFMVLWLREIVPDLLAGDPSRSAGVWRTPTNPGMYSTWLSFFLPWRPAASCYCAAIRWATPLRPANLSSSA